MFKEVRNWRDSPKINIGGYLKMEIKTKDILNQFRKMYQGELEVKELKKVYVMINNYLDSLEIPQEKKFAIRDLFKIDILCLFDKDSNPDSVYKNEKLFSLILDITADDLEKLTSEVSA